MSTKSKSAIRFIKTVTGYTVASAADGYFYGTVRRSGKGWRFTALAVGNPDGAYQGSAPTRAAAVTALVSHAATVAQVERTIAAKPATVATKAPVVTAADLRDARETARVVSQGVDNLSDKAPSKRLPPVPMYGSWPGVDHAMECVDCGTALKASTPHRGDRCVPCADAFVTDAKQSLKGPGVLALILCVLAMSTGACATQSMRPATMDLQLKSAAAASAAMHAQDDEERGADEAEWQDTDEGGGGVDEDACDDCSTPVAMGAAFTGIQDDDSDDEDCDADEGGDGCDEELAPNPAAQALRARLGANDPGGTIYLDSHGTAPACNASHDCDCDDVKTLSDARCDSMCNDGPASDGPVEPSGPHLTSTPGFTIQAASESEADAVVAAVKARKAPRKGAEIVTATCPVAFKVWDAGLVWRFVCDATGTVVVAPKSTADAGLAGRTVGNPSAEWVR